MNRHFSYLLLAVLVFIIPDMARAEIESTSPTEPQLVRAVMCENTEKYAPVNEAVVFSIDLGRMRSFFWGIPQR